MTHRSVSDVFDPAVEERGLPEHGRHVGRVIQVKVGRREVSIQKYGVADTLKCKETKFICGQRLLWHSCCIQCDQIGRFFMVLADMVSIKSSPNAW